MQEDERRLLRDSSYQTRCRSGLKVSYRFIGLKSPLESWRSQRAESQVPARWQRPALATRFRI